MTTPPVRTVAVVDDDRRVLTSFANLLASGGYGTRAYESPVEVFLPTVTRVWYALLPTW
jgi:FixJ family two-component response regulator